MIGTVALTMTHQQSQFQGKLVLQRDRDQDADRHIVFQKVRYEFDQVLYDGMIWRVPLEAPLACHLLHVVSAVDVA